MSILKFWSIANENIKLYKTSSSAMLDQPSVPQEIPDYYHVDDFDTYEVSVLYSLWIFFFWKVLFLIFIIYPLPP